MANSLRHIIHNECANWISASCLTTTDHSCCALAGERCAYFERAVAPLAIEHPKEFGPAVREYNRALKAGGVKLGAVRHCDCGEPLPPRKRYCETCAAKRRREQTRRAVARGRE